ncbi:MAG: hypothetical protein ACK5HT_07610 [Draconibacterium sp.]
MKLTPVSAGNFHCDGGVLLGIIPKVLWSKVYASDENNFTKLALRCLLVETKNRKILIETGIGDHYPDKHLQNNGVSPVNELGESLKKAGISNTSITDVLFTHLHSGQMIPLINTGDKTFAYMSDLIPTAANSPLLWISAYDLDPVKVMSEKQNFLEEAAEKDYILFFEHDYYTECATLSKSEKGVVLKEKFALKEISSTFD